MEIDINIKTKEITGIITDDLEIIDDIKRKSILKVGIVREDYLSANFLNKVGLNIPFMADLSVKLKDYDLIDSIILDKNRMVDILWK